MEWEILLRSSPGGVIAGRSIGTLAAAHAEHPASTVPKRWCFGAAITSASPKIFFPSVFVDMNNNWRVVIKIHPRFQEAIDNCKPSNTSWRPIRLRAPRVLENTPSTTDHRLGKMTGGQTGIKVFASRGVIGRRGGGDSVGLIIKDTLTTKFRRSTFTIRHTNHTR